jgi:hypothetical protein
LKPRCQTTSTHAPADWIYPRRLWGLSPGIGALEPQFYALLLAKLGLAYVDPAWQYDNADLPALKARFTALFASRPRAR